MIGVLCILIALTILIGSNNMQTVDATSYAEYPAACRADITAMEAFCRCMTHPAIRALCRNVTYYAGTVNVTMCTEFCANNL